jgi:flagellar protein FlaG
VRGGSAPGPAQAAPEPETSAKAAPPQTPERTLSISIDKETGRTVVHLIDVASGSVIRQIPTEEMLAVARVIARVQAAANQVKG